MGSAGFIGALYPGGQRFASGSGEAWTPKRPGGEAGASKFSLGPGPEPGVDQAFDLVDLGQGFELVERRRARQGPLE
ncbi:MAG TPA: hypothetical protein VFT07_07330, partial [Sphingomicrobium sp.]|nr:hypothetical protein [Sphingomicrobium sp.]